MRKLFIAALLLLGSLASEAKVTFPGVVGDHMVLQRNTEVTLWGWTDGKKPVVVTPSWSKTKYKASPDDNGRWEVKVRTADAGGPYTITFNDGEKTVLQDILLGEVWICAGQSNMEMPVCGFMYQPVEHAAETIVYAADYPLIRMYNTPHRSLDTPTEQLGGAWDTATPEAVSRFSATAYFFGQTLSRLMPGIPVGLVSPNWGGSNIVTWMKEDTIDAIPGIDHALAKSKKGDADTPQRLYNGMIHPLHYFTAKGFIWYQGESNRYNWFDYRDLFVALVRSWRALWGNPEMPFYYVQLAPYTYEGDNYRSLAMVIEAQWQALKELDHAGIAATTDIGNRTCIHPQKKQEVGRRLAYLALANEYGIKGLPKPAPTLKGMEKVKDERRGNMLLLSFNNLSEVYKWNDPDSFVGYLADGYNHPDGFEIAGEDKVWHKARGNYRWWHNQIEVWSDEVPEPVAVRYAFKNYCKEANVITSMGQPLPPFRTDDWEVDDIGEIR